MKAISLWEPWASAIAERCKWNETRSWHTSYRGTLLICASQKKSRDLRDHSEYLAIEFPKLIFLRDYDRLRFGHATAIVTLSDCVRTEDIREKLSPMELALGDYSDGRFAWVFSSIDKIHQPFPVTGKQGFFDVKAG